MEKQELEIKFTKLENIELPEFIYKYRSWNDEFHKRFITHREIFFASPGTFEDKFDCYNPTRFDLLTKKQIYDYFMWSSVNDNPNFTRQQHRHFARDWSKTSAVNDKEYTKAFMENSVKEYYHHQGILSLTENYNNDFMWDKYADNDKGFCIGYNTKLLFNHIGMGGPVEYVDELPIIFPEPIMDIFTASRNRVFFKHKKWKEEEEYRASKFFPNKANIGDRQIKIPENAFNRIIIGNSMAESDKDELKKEIIKNIGEIEIVERKNVT